MMEMDAGEIAAAAVESGSGAGEGWIGVTFSRSSKVYYYKTHDMSNFRVGQELEIHNQHGPDTLKVVSVGQGPGSQRTSLGQFMAYKYIEDRTIY